MLDGPFGQKKCKAHSRIYNLGIKAMIYIYKLTLKEKLSFKMRLEILYGGFHEECKQWIGIKGRVDFN